MTETTGMRPRFRRPSLLSAGAALVTFSLLCGLGTWQVQRLGWKEDLIAKRMARIDGPLITAAELSSDLDAIEYRRLTVLGDYDHETEMLLSASKREGTSGTNLVTLMRLTEPAFLAGQTLVVDRGYIPLNRREPSSRPQSRQRGSVEVSGWIRKSWPSGLVFTPENDFTSGHMLIMDIQGYTDYLGQQALPFYLQAGPNGLKTLPLGRKPTIDLPNRHAGYAITWYGLALVLLGVFGAFHWRRGG